MTNIYNTQDYIWDKDYQDKMFGHFTLSEEDFYPPVDDRTLSTLVFDINEDVSFVEYTKYIFDLYEEEEFYEN